MFAGLVEELGEVARLVEMPPGKRLVIRARRVAEDAKIGDSISVNGCCLTIVERHGDELAFEAGPETLQRTNLGEFVVGSPVNLERSLQVGDRLGGHFVTGHVDATGQVRQRDDDREWSTFWFACPLWLTREMASKGSVAVDGVSLTLVDVVDDGFSVALIPHTLQVTTLGQKQVGATVNLESDLLAKYVRRQLDGSSPA